MSVSTNFKPPLTHSVVSWASRFPPLHCCAHRATNRSGHTVEWFGLGLIQSKGKTPAFLGDPEAAKTTLELYPKTVAHTSERDDVVAQTTGRLKAEMYRILQ